MVFIPIAYFKKRKSLPDAPPHKFAILISARNEEAVIASLLDSLSAQDYPSEFFDIFVTADNSDDATADIARSYGATVYERHNTEEIGKGYVLDFMLRNLWRDYGEDAYDAFIVFDADNLVDRDYLSEMNKTFANGYDVISSYRNTANYGDGWRAAGVGMFFLRDSRILNDARMKVGSGTFVAGTGFLFSNDLAKRRGGWPYHTLTEDFEFSVNAALNGERTAYCGTARFYDWQSTGFRQSWRQKLRWTKGSLEVISKYGREVLRGLFSRNAFCCFDMTVSIFGAYFTALLAIIINVIGSAAYIACGGNPIDVLLQAAILALGAYFALLLFSLSVTVSEWSRLRATGFKKLLYCLTFPFYIFSFIPVAFTALFVKKVEWKPIYHGTTEKKKKKKSGAK